MGRQGWRGGCWRVLLVAGLLLASIGAQPGVATATTGSAPRLGSVAAVASGPSGGVAVGAASAAPPRTELPPPAPTVVEGVPLLTFTVGNVAMYYQDGVMLDQLAAVLDALAVAMVAAPAGLGLPPLEGTLNLYIFADEAAYLAGISQITGTPPERLGTYTHGYSMYGAKIRHPGIYYFTRASDEPATLAHLITHEYIHQIIRQTLNGRSIGQWYNEGMADAVAYTLLRPQATENQDRRYQGWLAEVAGGLAQTSVIPLSGLESGAEFVRLGNTGVSHLEYAESALAVDLLSQQAGLAGLGSVIARVGGGERWPNAFQATFGQSLDQFGAAFVAGLPDRFPAVFPVAGPPTTRFFFVVAGLGPGEAWTARYVRPNGSRPDPVTGTASSSGVVRTSFGTTATSLRGDWQLTVTDSHGNAVTLAFRVEG